MTWHFFMKTSLPRARGVLLGHLRRASIRRRLVAECVESRADGQLVLRIGIDGKLIGQTGGIGRGVGRCWRKELSWMHARGGWRRPGGTATRKARRDGRGRRLHLDAVSHLCTRRQADTQRPCANFSSESTSSSRSKRAEANREITGIESATEWEV